MTGVVRLPEDRRYAAEPKFDGQRAQLHVAGRPDIACYSRPGQELLRHRGLPWLREVRWPVPAAILDGEIYADDGHGGQSTSCSSPPTSPIA